MGNDQKWQEIDAIFHPRAIALVGISSEPTSEARHFFLNSMLNSGYKGKLYPVNPRASEVMGLNCYPTLKDIPEAVDYVICLTPAHITPQIMEQCGEKGVKVAHVFTAGFSETGEEDGMRLEREVATIGRQRGFRIIGPNCMGIYCPSTGLTFNPGFSKDSGPVGYISQSGGNARKLVDLGGIRGIRFSRVVSYGNACDLDESDFLEYLTKDPQTEIIAAYVEGVRDGQRFLQALTEAAKTKPVIMLKGGRTKAGTRAVASHTGAIAGSEEIWAALFRQTGVLRVYDLDELTDLILAFLHLTPGAGRNVGLITLGGGAAVQAADDCEVAGLSVLPFPPQVLEELRRFTPAAGTSIRNPVDSMMIRPQMFAETTRVVASCPQIDLLINLLEVDTVLRFFGGRERLGEMVDTLIEARKEWRKPIVAIFHTAGSPQAAQAVIEEQEKCFRAGIPSYPSIGRASRAISRFIQYHQDRGSND